jgi:hypothetical protein
MESDDRYDDEPKGIGALHVSLDRNRRLDWTAEQTLVVVKSSIVARLSQPRTTS